MDTVLKRTVFKTASELKAGYIRRSTKTFRNQDASDRLQWGCQFDSHRGAIP